MPWHSTWKLCNVFKCVPLLVPKHQPKIVSQIIFFGRETNPRWRYRIKRTKTPTFAATRRLSNVDPGQLADLSWKTIGGWYWDQAISSRLTPTSGTGSLGNFPLVSEWIRWGITCSWCVMYSGYIGHIPSGPEFPRNLLGQKLGARDRCQLDVWWALDPLGQLTEQGDWQMIFSGGYVT